MLPREERRAVASKLADYLIHLTSAGKLVWEDYSNICTPQLNALGIGDSVYLAKANGDFTVEVYLPNPLIAYQAYRIKLFMPTKATSAVYEDTTPTPSMFALFELAIAKAKIHTEAFEEFMKVMRE